MRALILLLPMVLLSFCVSVINANTIHIPADSSTIQAGINGAVGGDTVLVADGTYTGDGNRDIDFLGKAIVVLSENGPENCIIDCEGSSSDPHRGFYFHIGEDSSSVVRGFTIQNSFVHSYGGGIKCENSSPTITGNIITGNTAGGLTGYGSGIYCKDSSPTITGNIITGNTTGGSSGRGGGIYCYSSSPTITGNTISGNSATTEGGGIYCYSSSPTITGNTITGNTVSANNGWGGGIFCFVNSSPTITGNTITGNTVSEYNGWGGGIFCRENSSPIITGNTITANTAGNDGGGIYCWDSSPTITNSILWGDSPDEIYIVSGNPVVTYTDIEGGWIGAGNIDADPMFVLPYKGDYRLLWSSPCIDTGHPDSLDADGTRRDMGAHYFNQLDYLTLYVTPDTTEVAAGGQLGVTYTAINRWDWPQPFWAVSMATLPGGTTRVIMGPDRYTLPAHHTEQVHMTHNIPLDAPMGVYDYWSGLGLPPGIVFDEDNFKFWVTE